MATAYTQGILNGSIKNFKEFALRCARAFDAASHMKDDDGSAVYRKRVYNSFYDEQIKETEKLINEFKSISDENIIKRKKENTEKRIEKFKNTIKETKQLEITLNNLLLEAKKYTPPTEEHKNLRYFMIEELENQLNNLNAESIRSDYLSDCYNRLKYYHKEKMKEIKRCETSNKWYDELIKSLEK
jgi:hypothetical protein